MIRLDGMEFKAFHGCLESERKEGNRFRVDLEYDYDISKAAETDDLAFAVDYSAVYDTIAAEMGKQSCLLENVAARIARAVRTGFPRITSGKVTVTKFNPPLDGFTESSSVSIDF